MAKYTHFKYIPIIFWATYAHNVPILHTIYIHNQYKQIPGEWARNSQEDQLPFSQQVVWAPEVPPGPLLLSEKEL